MNVSVPQVIRGVKIKGHLKTSVAQQMLVQLLCDRVRSCFPQTLAGLKDDLSLVLLLCRCVENSGCDRYKFDKKELVIAVLTKLFPDQLTRHHIEVISGHIDVLCENGLVKKLSRWSTLWYSVCASQKNDK